MKRRHLLWFAAALPFVGVGGCIVRENWPASPVTKSFSPTGIKVVILRASETDNASVTTGTTQQIEVSGLPVGGAEGYHSPAPFWRPTPAKDWGLDFVSKRYGDKLVISTTHEILYIHHHYALKDLNIRVPDGIQVIKEERNLNGDPAPNLTPPNLTSPN